MMLRKRPWLGLGRGRGCDDDDRDCSAYGRHVSGHDDHGHGRERVVSRYRT